VNLLLVNAQPIGFWFRIATSTMVSELAPNRPSSKGTKLPRESGLSNQK
jgi:hypothetical protein